MKKKLKVQSKEEKKLAKLINIAGDEEADKKRSKEIEMKKQIEKLININESLELTIESIGDGVITTDKKGKITSINKTAENLTEWKKENAIGLEFDIVFNLRNFLTKETIPTSIHEIMNNKSSVGLKEGTILVSKSGKEFFVSASISNIIDVQNHTAIGIVIVFRDITRIKMLENEVRWEKEQAQDANKAKSAFLANMSHEIRTPLNGIDGMIDLTLFTKLTEEQRENLIVAKECSKSLMEVINNILDFSKIEAEEMKLKKTEFYIKDLIDNTVKTNIVHAMEKGIQFTSKIHPGINEKLIGDYGKIQQILNNLICNAIKFTNQGSVFLVAEKLSEDSNMTVFKFSVIDTGIGISSEDRSKLFKSFSQVDGTYTKKYGGTGLGLIISKKLAELMGGDIFVESIKGKGSTFTLTINIEKFSNIENQKEMNKSNHEDIIVVSISRKILIVEDNKANQVVISKMCSMLNHKVKIAEDGKKALEILKNENFDMILMDVQMPIMDGIEATKIIRKDEIKSGKHIPIVALTAYSLAGDREKFLKLGMDDYLSKPISVEGLNKCIEKTLFKVKYDSHYDAAYYLNINEVNPNRDDQNASIEKIGIEIYKLKDFILKENYKGCENSAHLIKDYSREIKSVIMKDASFRAELAARRNDINGLKEQIGIIEDEYNRMKKSV